jgi:hypothetical protein
MSSTADASLTIAARFAGPPGSGNGGYTSGRLARCLSSGQPVTVTLRRPPPLETELGVSRAADEEGRDEARLLTADGSLVAVAGSGGFDAAPPAAIGVEVATAAESSYAGLSGHPFPGCFVCGPDRTVGDGLRLSPGRYAAGHTACVWTPDASLRSDDDPARAAAEFVWAALDCPGGWASDLESRPLVLGRMTAAYERLPALHEPYVVVGEVRGNERRKTYTSSALYDAAGRLLGRAEHTWIAVDPTRF